VIGILAGAICFFASTEIKRWHSLDVFGVHGVGGILGTTLSGVASASPPPIARSRPQSSCLSFRR
jgi:ammonia channel protein AmtB